MRPPGYYWYPGDYLRDTAALTLAQDGAYRRLLDHYYATRTPLPDDEESIFRIARAYTQAERDATAAVARMFFPVGEDGMLHNRRADMEILRAEEYDAKKGQRGKIAASARWTVERQKKEKRLKAKAQAAAPPEPKQVEEKVENAPGVWLTPTEAQKLVEKHGAEAAAWMVSKLSNHKAANGTTYKSDYAAINNWVVTAYEEWQSRLRKADRGGAVALLEKPKPSKYYSTCKCGFVGNMKKTGLCDVCAEEEAHDDSERVG